MKSLPSSLLRLRRAGAWLLLFLVLGTPGLAPRGGAQTTPPAAARADLDVKTLPYELGRLVSQGATGSSEHYVFATAPTVTATKGQQLQLVTRTLGEGRTQTSYVLVNTGKTKTLAQLNQILLEAFRRFLTEGPKPVGQSLGKIGDIRYGGELQLVCESPSILRFDYQPTENPGHPPRLGKADVSAFAAILSRQ